MNAWAEFRWILALFSLYRRHQGRSLLLLLGTIYDPRCEFVLKMVDFVRLKMMDSADVYPKMMYFVRTVLFIAVIASWVALKFFRHN